MRKPSTTQPQLDCPSIRGDFIMLDLPRSGQNSDGMMLIYPK